MIRDFKGSTLILYWKSFIVPGFVSLHSLIDFQLFLLLNEQHFKKKWLHKNMKDLSTIIIAVTL